MTTYWRRLKSGKYWWRTIATSQRPQRQRRKHKRLRCWSTSRQHTGWIQLPTGSVRKDQEYTLDANRNTIIGKLPLYISRDIILCRAVGHGGTTRMEPSRRGSER